MKPDELREVFSCRFRPEFGLFGSGIRLNGRVRAHSCHGPVQNSLARHPQVAQCKQRAQLRRVLDQATVTHLHMAILAFDDSKQVFHLGTDAGLGLLQFLQDRAHWGVLVQRTVLARHHCHVPVNLRMGLPDLLSLFNAVIARVCKHVRLGVVQQLVRLGDVMLVGCRGCDRVHQARICVHADMRLHAEMPLVTFLGLVQLGIAPSTAVLGRTRRRNQRGVDGRALPEHQSFRGQSGVDRGQDLLGQTMLLEQMTETQDADPVRQSVGVAEPCKRAIERHIEQGFLHREVAQPEPQLQEMQAQHDLVTKRRAAGRLGRCRLRDQRDQLTPRHHQFHLVEELRLARAPRTQVQTQVLLLHAHIVSRLRLRPSPWKSEF